VNHKALPESHRPAGILTTAELLAAGVTTNQIRALVQRGILVRLGRGVYADATKTRRYSDLVGGEHLLQAVAALAVVGSGATISRQSAAQVYGIALLRNPGKTVTLTCPPQHGGRGRAGIKLYAADLPSGHLDGRLRFRLTTPARTVVDLARTLDFRAGVVSADSALHNKLTTKDELRSVITACPRRRGIQRAREVVEFADGLAESPLESIARVVFRDCHLPPPQLQVWLREDVRVDFYWEKYRTIAEVDGAAKYELDPRRGRGQLDRDRLLRREGFEIVHFTWAEITENPRLVTATIRDAFMRGTSRAPRLKVASATAGRD
jgi:Transcriptional regulator, AbiEi antitoxin/Protein of unknown function (DUF559)